MVEADARGKVASRGNLVDLEAREVVLDKVDNPGSPVVDVGLSGHNVRSST